MDKRTFIKIGTTLGVGAAFGGLTFTAGCASPENNKEENGDIQTYPFELPALAYSFDALEPHIDAATMEIHHGRHHQGYVNNLNAVLENGSHANSSLENILSGIGENDTALRNNGGGHYNHKLFWEIIGPQAGGEPDGNLREAINSTFGNLNAMKDAFEKAALGVFGSGWAWLVADSNNKLQIVQSPNQDNPLMYGIYPGDKVNILMGIDVWEHAYYLHYQNRRADYVKAFWNIVRWDKVAERLG